MNTLEFFGEVAMMSPQDEGTHLELGVEGQGMRALSQILGAGVGGFCALWQEWPQIWHTALPWLPFLEINYIFCTQRQFKFVVSELGK